MRVLILAALVGVPAAAAAVIFTSLLKVGARSRAQLVAKAIGDGLVVA